LFSLSRSFWSIFSNRSKRLSSLQIFLSGFEGLDLAGFAFEAK